MESALPLWRRPFIWVRHRWRFLSLSVLLLFVLLNILAYRHARSMLNFAVGAERTPAPHSLSIFDKLIVLTSGVSIPRPEVTFLPDKQKVPWKTITIKSDEQTTLEGWLFSPAKPKGTVLLFHGYAACRCHLLQEGYIFYDLGYSVLLIDFRGSGGSSGSSTTLGYEEARDVAATLKHARSLELPEPIILFGQSMGGAAVLRSVATLEVRPDAVIVESVFARMLGAVRNRFALMGAPSFPGAELLVFWGGVQLGFSGFEHNPAEYARSCPCPTLVFHGADDRHAPLEEGRAIYDNLPGKREIIVFEGAGHVSLAGTAPQKWRNAVEAFLER